MDFRCHFISSAILIQALCSDAGGIAIYWDQNGNEDTLADTCASGYYNYVNLAFLTTFGGGGTLMMNLAGHCNSYSDGCKNLTSDIKSCQAKGVEVMLSIGGASEVMLSIGGTDMYWDDLAKYL